MRQRSTRQVTPETPAQKKRAERGKRAENAAAEHYRAHGFDVLFQNLRLGALELDLVLRKADLVVVAEVRTRAPASYVTALASITKPKRVLLFRAIERLWSKHLVKMPDVQRVRVDVVAVRLDGDEAEVEVIEGALTQNDA